MDVNGINVEQSALSDIRTCWSFTFDYKTFYRVTLDEGDDNLQTWISPPNLLGFRPNGWILPPANCRGPLWEHDEDVAELVTAFVRELAAKHPEAGA